MQSIRSNFSEPRKDSTNNQLLVDEIFSKPPEKKYITYKTNVSHTDNTWSLYKLDINDYAPEKKTTRYISLVIDTFSNFGWTVPFKTKKNSQTIANFSEIVLNSSKIDEI